MAPRISRSSVASASTSKSKKPRQKSQKRNLNAYSIAEAENPERSKVRKHRLGDLEEALPDRKRARAGSDDEQDEDEEEEEGSRPRKNARRGGDSDLDEGSDSDGNTWQMGNVDDDDDSDIDSDEAFGESDEEKFEGYTFRGSSTTKTKKAPRKKSRNDEEMNLDEEEEEEAEDDSDDSLGEDAVDLATMLDNYEESEDEKPVTKGKKRRGQDEDEDAFSDESDEDDAPSEMSLSDAEGEIEDPQQLLRLQDLISSMTPAEEAAERKRKGYDALESSAPSDSATIGTGKIDLADLIPITAGSKLRQAAKILRDDVKASKRNGIPAKVEVPLPKRQQDKLDRIAANKKTKETLDRWTDTVQQNRQAEHLSFPLKHGDETELEGSRRFLPTTKPQNDLESNIQNILLKSGLITQSGKVDEDKIRQFEELETKKLPQEEVEARRAELRRARELLFREEVRAKRIKKIKSKSYRRVHRKERERLEQKERAMLEAEGVDLEEADRELNDRRRAEERMGAKHRESKWAKGVKKSGKAAWDDDARAGVTEMARRNEELRKRMLGKDVRNDSEADSDVSSGDDESDVEDADERQARKVERQLQRVSAQEGQDGAGSKLANMAFMKKAEAARQARNDEEIRQMRKDLAGEETDSEEEENRAANVGRRKYGPLEALPLEQAAKEARNAFEEHESVDEDAAEDKEVKIILDNDYPSKSQSSRTKASNQLGKSAAKIKEISSLDQSAAPRVNPWEIRKKSKKDEAPQAIRNLEPPPILKSKKSKPKNTGGQVVSAPDGAGWQTVLSNGNDDQDNESDVSSVDSLVIKHRDLMSRGFAGDDAVADFEAEKNALVVEEDEKIVDDTIPGWGTWVGDGLTKREQARNKGKIMRKQEGIKPADRKDAKLQRVIINEKRVRKNAKYLATQLPHEFENRHQYERSLRMPKGVEWNTQQTFNDGTKPRLLMKQGIILPPERPMA